MNILLMIIAAAFGIAGLIASILILIEAFKDEVWKGIVSLLCGLYFLYYALFEFEHDNKWLLVLLSFCGNVDTVKVAKGLES